MKLKTVLALIIIAFIVIFSLQNSEATDVESLSVNSQYHEYSLFWEVPLYN